MQDTNGRWDPFDDYVVDFALARVRAGERVAIVTLVTIEGSSPRPLGAQMAVSEGGEWVGYLSGGCIERAVVAEAIEAIMAGRNRRVRYGRGSNYLDIQLPCGSAIELEFDVTMSEQDLAAIDTGLRHRQSGFMKLPGDALRSHASVELRHYLPRRRLIVLGVGPAAICLARLGAMTGFEAELISPDLATRAACEREGVVTRAIDSAAARPELRADARSAIVFMFHDHEWEAELLPAALESEAFYIGAMGGWKTHLRRLETLRRQGIDAAAQARIHGPAGLFHGARSAHAVAVSILAEIMQSEAGNASSDIFLQREDQLVALPDAVPAGGPCGRLPMPMEAGEVRGARGSHRARSRGENLLSVACRRPD